MTNKAKVVMFLKL